MNKYSKVTEEKLELEQRILPEIHNLDKPACQNTVTMATRTMDKHLSHQNIPKGTRINEQLMKVLASHSETPFQNCTSVNGHTSDTTLPSPVIT